MDPLTAFQQQLSGPVYGFIGQFWPAMAIGVLAIVAWFLAPARWRNSDGVVVDMSLDGDSDGGDGGGDGGGGD